MGQDHRAALHINSVNAGWTEERIERLVSLWTEGWSATQVGRDLKVTRNAVIGMVHRRGLHRSSASRPAKVARVAAARPKIAANQLAGINAARRALANEPPGIPLGAAALPGSAPRPWITRTFGECTWPIGDGEGPDLLSCCLPVVEKGWCLAHFVRGTQRPAPSSKPAGAERHRRAA